MLPWGADPAMGGRSCQPTPRRIFTGMCIRITINSTGVAFVSSRPWTQLSLTTSEAVARHADLDQGGLCSRRVLPSLICLLGWGQGLCEGGLCSDRLWALPPVPRQIYFKVKLHTSSRLLSGPHLLCPRAQSSPEFVKERSFVLFIISFFSF